MVIGAIATRIVGFRLHHVCAGRRIVTQPRGFPPAHLDRQRLLAAAQDDAAQRCDVAEVAAPAQHDMLVAARRCRWSGSRSSQPCSGPSHAPTQACDWSAPSRRVCPGAAGSGCSRRHSAPAGRSPRSTLIIRWVKSWHTPSRRRSTSAIGVLVVVTPARKVKSRLIRAFRSSSAASTGRPAVKLAAA